MSLEEIFIQFFYYFFLPLKLTIPFLFDFVPSLLQMFSASLGLITIGIVLDSFDRTKYKILKWFLYIYFMLYTAYSFDILERLFTADILDFATIMFGIVAPICMMIVGRQISSVRVKGLKIFNYYTLWVLYLIICTIWKIYFPEQMMYYIIVWGYFVINVLVLYYFLSKGGNVQNE